MAHAKLIRILYAVNYRIVVGADEAGYGPNLGPLVIGASAWLIPQDMSTEVFTSLMEGDFKTSSWQPGCQHIPLGDSKVLYQTASGLATLEAGLLALIKQLHPAVVELESLLQAVQFIEQPHSSVLDIVNAQPWYRDLNLLPVPGCHEGAEIDRLAATVQLRLEAMNIKLLGVRAIIVSETNFNTQVDRLGSKGQLLSIATLQLVRSFCDQPEVTAEIFCDRQGGRKNYLPILLETFPDEWFIERSRTNKRCSYRNSGSPQRDFHFTVGGDSFAPTALASMLCKYLRERLMESLNNFWRGHLPQIRATAGYPVDAKRYRDEIAALAQKLNLEPEQWWRSR